MEASKDVNEKASFDELLLSMIPGNVYFVTGKNGSGKSRFFAYSTNKMRQEQLRDGYESNRLLCLSGTMHDKYPPIVYKSKTSDENVVYLGNKVNNNMVSDTAPFRTLCHYMIRSIALNRHGDIANKYLQRLNFEQTIRFKFRYGKSRKAEVFSSVSSQLDCDLLHSQNDTTLVNRYIEHLQAGDILLADMIFFRGDEPYGLGELSSGEKQYALALLGLIYCGSPNCTIYYDEPENSLHPSWQLSIVKDLSIIAKELHAMSTLVVATHSPLIASSVRNSGAFVCDFPAGQAWQRSELHGRASDTVLREQFHLYSARSPEVSVVVNRCLDLIARNETGSPEFSDVQGELRAYNLELSHDDPIHDVIATILRF